MVDAAEVIGALVPSGWRPEFAGWLSVIPSSPMTVSSGAYQRQVEAGNIRALLWTVNGRPAGVLLYKIEWTYEGRAEFVIVAAAAPEYVGQSLCEFLLPGIEEHAARVGCKRVRVHTARAGMAARLRKSGYVAGETVFVKGVA